MCSQPQDKIEAGRGCAFQGARGFPCQHQRPHFDGWCQTLSNVLCLTLGFNAANDVDLFDPSITENDWYVVGQSVSEVPSSREFQENSGLCANLAKKKTFVRL